MRGHIITCLSDSDYQTFINSGFAGLYPIDFKSSANPTNPTDRQLRSKIRVNWDIIADLKRVKPEDYIFLHTNKIIYGPFKATSHFLESPNMPNRFKSNNLNFQFWKTNCAGPVSYNQSYPWKIGITHIPNVTKVDGFSSMELFKLTSVGLIQSIPQRFKYHDMPKIVKQTNNALQRAMTRQLEKINQAIDELCRKDKELKQNTALLCSIPGISTLSAVRILAYGRNTLLELNRNALTAHAGLAPAQKQSGISINAKARIAKQGDRRLRTTLYMPALVAAFHNPRLKIFYQRLVKKGKPKMLALVAVMKKLLLMVQAILKKKTPFNPKFALDS